MKKRFVKKNAVALAVLLGVVLVGGGVLARTLQKENPTDTSPLSVRTNAQKIVEGAISQDSDNDGLKDWEELLLKTDPKNPDTDGDKTLDGEEVLLNRNPLVAGPDDQSTEDILQKAKADRSAIENLPETERLAYELFEGYLDLKKRRYLGTDIEKNFVTGLVEQNIPKIVHTPYSASVVSVHSDTSKEALLSYRKTLSSALSPLFDVREDELVTFTKILEKRDTSKYAQLEFAQKKYLEAVNNLIALSVPNNAQSIHLDLINSLDFFAVVVGRMITTAEDPLVALAVVDGYTEGEKKIKSATGRLNTHLLSYGITYE